MKEDIHLTVVKGSITNPLTGKIYFCSFTDSVNMFLEEKSVMDSCIIDKDGNYRFSLDWKKPDIFDLRMDNRILASNLFLIPGVKVTLNFIGENNKPQAVLNDNEQLDGTDYLIRFKDTFYTEIKARRYYYIESNSLSVPQFFAYIEKRQEQQINFLHNYFGCQNSTGELYDFVSTEIYYQGAADKLIFLWKKRTKGEKKMADSTYYHFFEQLIIENPVAINSPAYRHFLKLCIDEWYQQLMENRKERQLEPENFSPNLEKYKIAQKRLHGIFLNFICANLIQDEFKNIFANDEMHHATMDTLIQSLPAKYYNQSIKRFIHNININNKKEMIQDK